LLTRNDVTTHSLLTILNTDSYLFIYFSWEIERGEERRENGEERGEIGKLKKNLMKSHVFMRDSFILKSHKIQFIKQSFERERKWRRENGEEREER